MNIRIKVTFYLRRRDAIEALGKLGISKADVDKAIRAGALAANKFNGPTSRGYYRAADVATQFGLNFAVEDSDCIIFSAPATT
tara:strand:- start:168 stop:416 length:249 start_codon:yes stop_codon:yes gene_type:complete